ncbi:uncharacterized protein EAF01_009399 [Botrytis porri]|uniref:Mannose-6-phosphate isomerase n=1 Tax=Botrytis porri TaxID=87229 RepID=A0A4Z1KMS5_9HELO|nr:uncharacterized protein EAF01_009399 [Botrytis porri]KAF7895437.1 hypothetical protein EAF01_009399 [Botrytis porri]TGO87311.1 hypothetical protein BPOR_0235g00120 [Botrytis porri]
MSESSSVIQLECQCNNYPWGRQGKESLAAKYAASTPGGKFKLDESKEYAEMWMGTYPTTPSLILSNGKDLQEHLNANKEKLIGKPTLDKFGADLPYLPKILSIAKALPLQIHPNKKLAAKLHEQDPEKFGDTNHKPEIAVALGKFEVFVGWKPISDIQSLFTSIPVLTSKFLSSSSDTIDKDTLKSIVHKILSLSDEEIKSIYNTLKDTPSSKFPNSPYIPDLLPRLADQYSASDPGNLVALLTMNYLILQKGDAIYVPADGIHAYLSGDIVECMARSDNVLNTGFCPRADRDSVDLFSAALTFSPVGKDECILKPTSSSKGKNGKTKVLAPPMSEFDMLVLELQKGEKETIEKLGGPSIMVVTGGKGTMKTGGEKFEVKEGYVFFVGVGTELEFEAEEGLEAHIAFCEA